MARLAFYRWPPPALGLDPHSQWVRSGIVPPAQMGVNVGQYANKILAQRKKILFHKTVSTADAYNSTTLADTWRCRFHTSPMFNRIRARFTLVPTEDVAGATTPQAYWTATIAGGASTQQASVYGSDLVAAATTITPAHWRDVTQTWTGINANETYECALTQDDGLRVLSCTIWEMANAFGSGTYADVSGYTVTGGIHDADVADLFDTTTALWARQGTQWINYSVPSKTAPMTTRATDCNPWTNSFTAWNAAAPGLYTAPQYHGSLETYNSGTNRETVPLVIGAYLKCSRRAPTATCTLTDSNGTIGTLTSTSTTAAWDWDAVDWVAPSNATMKIDPLIKCSGGATAAIYAICMYEYES